LDYAVRLGNEHKGKTSISFVSSEGIVQVETTIWSVRDKELSLKGGISIPLAKGMLDFSSIPFYIN
jgi:hypothetical protein